MVAQRPPSQPAGSRTIFGKWKARVNRSGALKGGYSLVALRRSAARCRCVAAQRPPTTPSRTPPAGYGSLAHTPGELPTQLCAASDAGGAASAASSGRSASGKRTPARCIQQQHHQPPSCPTPPPPGFPFKRRVEGYITGYHRVFWQGSTDHRGTPEAPGRTVTLHPEPGATTVSASRLHTVCKSSSTATCASGGSACIWTSSVPQYKTAQSR